uniref:Uncharacterized protein n=1 Tax=Oryza brachyantha TaxID=4533 RepID=J3LZD0_ORYBR
MALEASFNPFTLLDRNDPGDDTPARAIVGEAKLPKDGESKTACRTAAKKKNDDKNKKKDNKTKQQQQKKKPPQEAGKGANAAGKKQDTTKYIGYKYREPVRAKRPVIPASERMKPQEEPTAPPVKQPPPPPPSFDDEEHFPALGKAVKR